MDGITQIKLWVYEYLDDSPTQYVLDSKLNASQIEDVARESFQELVGQPVRINKFRAGEIIYKQVEYFDSNYISLGDEVYIKKDGDSKYKLLFKLSGPIKIRKIISGLSNGKFVFEQIVSTESPCEALCKSKIKYFLGDSSGKITDLSKKTT